MPVSSWDQIPEDATVSVTSPPTYQARLESDSQRRIAAAAKSLEPHASVCSSSDGHVVLAVTDSHGSMRVLRMLPCDARALSQSLNIHAAAVENP
jgi:hypothetical protein